MKKLPKNTVNKESNTPFILILMQKCTDYRIPYDLMCRLNYNDLLYMVVNYDILKIKELLNQKKQLDKDSPEVVDATPEMATSFFR